MYENVGVIRQLFVELFSLELGRTILGHFSTRLVPGMVTLGFGWLYGVVLSGFFLWIPPSEHTLKHTSFVKLCAWAGALVLTALAMPTKRLGLNGGLTPIEECWFYLTGAGMGIMWCVWIYIIAGSMTGTLWEAGSGKIVRFPASTPLARLKALFAATRTHPIAVFVGTVIIFLSVSTAYLLKLIYLLKWDCYNTGFGTCKASLLEHIIWMAGVVCLGLGIPWACLILWIQRRREWSTLHTVRSVGQFLGSSAAAIDYGFDDERER